mmetsp:Transcript_3349/g.3902  ORF Transcript_3349/g.3902 Transcript_3349/m.3902 type:complete len:118 (+) Transcript_3349:172-525(+)
MCQSIIENVYTVLSWLIRWMNLHVSMIRSSSLSFDLSRPSISTVPIIQSPNLSLQRKCFIIRIITCPCTTHPRHRIRGGVLMVWMDFMVWVISIMMHWMMMRMRRLMWMTDIFFMEG